MLSVPGSRATRWSVALVTGILGTLLGVQPAAHAAPAVPPGAHQVMAHPSASPGSTEVPNPIDELPAQTSADGPVGPADRDLLVRVRLAGLWEMPASDLAVTKGASPKVREIGAKIGAQHAALDALVIKAAARLKVPLPDVATPEQRGWVGEMQRATGSQFDLVFVDRLRAAHGKILPAIGTVRAGTRNEVVRELAAQANAFVLTHIILLESTGLVDYDSLPLPPVPPPADAAAAAVGKVGDSALLSATDAQVNPGGISPTVIWLVLLAALVAGAYSMVRLIRPR